MCLMLSVEVGFLGRGLLLAVCVRLWISIGRNVPRISSASGDDDLRVVFRMGAWRNLMLIAIPLELESFRVAVVIQNGKSVEEQYNCVVLVT